MFSIRKGMKPRLGSESQEVILLASLEACIVSLACKHSPSMSVVSLLMRTRVFILFSRADDDCVERRHSTTGQVGQLANGPEIRSTQRPRVATVVDVTVQLRPSAEIRRDVVRHLHPTGRCRPARRPALVARSRYPWKQRPRAENGCTNWPDEYRSGLQCSAEHSSKPRSVN